MSQILDAFGRPALAPAPVAHARPGLYRISRDTEHRKWMPSLSRDVRALMPQWRQRALVSDSRHIYTSGGGQISGAVHDKADAVVGNAWQPVYAGADKDFGRLAQELLAEWYDRCVIGSSAFDFISAVWLGSKSVDVDGDFFILPTYAADKSYPMLRFVEGHRVGSRVGEQVVSRGRYAGARIDSGIVYDRRGWPLAIQLLGDQPEDDEFISLRQAIHVFDPIWYSQGRGVPALSFSVLDWYDLGEIAEAERIAVKTHSKLALIQKTPGGRKPVYDQIVDGGVDIGADTLPSVSEISDGMIKYVAAHGEVQTHLGNRPGNGWIEFMEWVARGAFAGLGWPAELGWKMDTSGAPARVVIRKARRTVTKRQRIMRRPMKRAILHAVSNFIERGDLPYVADWYKWRFTLPPVISIDDANDRKADREDFRMGLADRGMIIEERYGMTLEDFLGRRADNEKLALEIAASRGLDSWRMGMMTPNGNDPDAVATTTTTTEDTDA